MMPSWGSIAQEKYANLHVHRTLTWQRILHVKPSQVYFTMETLAWSPDGMQLAVGCDEGELVMFEMDRTEEHKGEEIKPYAGDDTLCHTTSIVAMHWVQMREPEENAKETHAKTPLANQSNRIESFQDSAHKLQKNPTSGTSVLVTADSAGNIGVWWNGVVLVAVIQLQKHFNTGNTRSVSPTTLFTIHSVMVTTDLSGLLVDVSHRVDLESDRLNRVVLTVDWQNSLQGIQRDLSVISRVGSEVRSILENVRASIRQITSEWKNATRVFELKMSLIGSLYEKYGCDEPPQVDMLAIIAGGIASPALAQYFAQDIQEMSVIRMQKTFFGGCDTIQSLSMSKIKPGLQKILFEVAELRGTVKWKHHAFSQTLAISPAELDKVIDSVGDLLAMMEEFDKAVHETRQDFSLLFAWLLERIRVHTNVGGSRPAQSTPTDSLSKSLLNVRRLVAFLECAAQSAKDYQIKKNNKWLVEVTFGNQVSKILSSTKLGEAANVVERQWSEIMTKMIRAFSDTLGPNNIVPLSLGDNVDEVLLHTRWIDLPQPSAWNAEAQSTIESEDSEEDDLLDAVDWESLESIHQENYDEADQTNVVSMIVVRRSHTVTFFTRPEGNMDSEWFTTTLQLNFLRGDHDEPFGDYRMCMYGGVDCGKQEQLVAACVDGKGIISVYLISYDSKFQRSLVDTSTQLPFVVGFEQVSRRTLRIPAPSTDDTAATVSAQASRGIVCIASGGGRLFVLDAEDESDEVVDEDKHPTCPTEEESTDHHEVNL